MLSKRARQLMQVRDIFAMRSQAGWLHFLLERSRIMPGWLETRFSRWADSRSVAFDAKYGTDTFTRRWVSVRSGVAAGNCQYDPSTGKWQAESSASGSVEGFGYGPVNPDFFREIMRSIPVDLTRYCMIDVGAGKGAAVMVASEFGFSRYLAVELDAELVRIGKENCQRYRESSGRTFNPEWVQGDFFDWTLPGEDSLVFLNNPFPEELSLQAVRHIEASVRDAARRVLLVYRKMPGGVGNYLHDSKLWTPLRLAPYWRVYASPRLAVDLTR